MGINSLKTHILIIVLTIVCSSSLKAVDGPGDFPGNPGRERPTKIKRGRQDTEKQRQLEQELKDTQDQISEMLDTLADVINGNESLHEEDLQVIKSTLEESSKYVLRMEKTNQCEYNLLKAWSNYYSNDSQTALKGALKAYKADPLNSDAKATVAVMSLVNGDYKAFASLKKPIKPKVEKKSKRKGRSTRPTRKRQTASKSKLNFNIEMIHTELLGKTIEPNVFSCLSGATIALPAENAVSCILVWKSDYQDDKKEEKKFSRSKSKKSRSADPGLFNPMMQAPGKSRSRSTGSAGDQIEAFKLLFMNYLDNSQIKFAALNVEKNVDKEEIAGYLMENPSLWAQILLVDNLGKDINKLSAIKTDQPVMVITATDGTICYAGSADSFVPVILLEKLFGLSNGLEGSLENLDKEKMNEVKDFLNKNSDKLSKKIEDKFGTPEEIKAIKKQIEQEDKPVENKKPQKQYGESETLEREIQAQKLYEQAEIHYKKGKYIGYGKCVDFAREIIEKFPETQYAEMSREMLKGLPRRKRQQFKVTDEEMGINN